MRATEQSFPAELGGPCALQTLQRKSLPYYLFMLVKTSLDGRKKKKRQKQQQQADTNDNACDEEEHRTSIFCSQFPVEVLKMLNDEPDAHVNHNLLTMGSSSNLGSTASLDIFDTLGTEASIMVLTDKNLILKQILQVTTQISRYYYYYAFQAFEPYPPEEDDKAAVTHDENATEDQTNASVASAQRLRTRRRGRKAFRYDFASIFGPVQSKETAEKLHAIWNERTRTIKSRAAISRTLAEILGLQVGLNEKLISGNPSLWDVRLVNGGLQMERKQAVTTAAADRHSVTKFDI